MIESGQEDMLYCIKSFSLLPICTHTQRHCMEGREESAQVMMHTFVLDHGLLVSTMIMIIIEDLVNWLKISLVRGWSL